MKPVGLLIVNYNYFLGHKIIKAKHGGYNDNETEAREIQKNEQNNNKTKKTQKQQENMIELSMI